MDGCAFGSWGYDVRSNRALGRDRTPVPARWGDHRYSRPGLRGRATLRRPARTRVHPARLAHRHPVFLARVHRALVDGPSQLISAAQLVRVFNAPPLIVVSFSL